MFKQICFCQIKTVRQVERLFMYDIYGVRTKRIVKKYNSPLRPCIHTAVYRVPQYMIQVSFQICFDICNFTRCISTFQNLKRAFARCFVKVIFKLFLCGSRWCNQFSFYHTDRSNNAILIVKTVLDVLIHLIWFLQMFFPFIRPKKYLLKILIF